MHRHPMLSNAPALSSVAAVAGISMYTFSLLVGEFWSSGIPNLEYCVLAGHQGRGQGHEEVNRGCDRGVAPFFNTHHPATHCGAPRQWSAASRLPCRTSQTPAWRLPAGLVAQYLVFVTLAMSSSLAAALGRAAAAARQLPAGPAVARLLPCLHVNICHGTCKP